LSRSNPRNRASSGTFHSASPELGLPPKVLLVTNVLPYETMSEHLASRFNGLYYTHSDALDQLLKFQAIYETSITLFSRYRSEVSELLSSPKHELNPFDDHRYKVALDNLSNDSFASFATSEDALDCPYFYSLLTIRSYSIFESLIDNTLVAYLRDYPEWLDKERFKKVRLSPSTFFEYNNDHIYPIILRELKRIVFNGKHKYPNKFEALLSIPNLDEYIPDTIKSNINEFVAVRNVLVHQLGLADDTFVSSCPEITSNIGERVSVTGKRFAKYFSTIAWYTLDINRRVCKFSGVKEFDNAPKLRDSFLKALESTKYDE